MLGMGLFAELTSYYMEYSIAAMLLYSSWEPGPRVVECDDDGCRNTGHKDFEQGGRELEYEEHKQISILPILHNLRDMFSRVSRCYTVQSSTRLVQR